MNFRTQQRGKMQVVVKRTPSGESLTESLRRERDYIVFLQEQIGRKDREIDFQHEIIRKLMAECDQLRASIDEREGLQEGQT